MALPRWKKLLRTAALATALAAAGLYVTRSRTLGPWLVSLARGPVEELLGARLDVERVGGSWFGSLRLEGVRLAPSDADAALALGPADVEVDYSLVGLVRGGLAGVESLTLDASTLEVWPERLAERFPSEPDPDADDAEASFSLPDALPRSDLRLDEVRVRFEDGREAGVRGCRLTHDAGPLALEVELAWKDEVRELVEPLRLRARYAPEAVSIESLALGNEGEWLALGESEVSLAPPFHVALEGELLRGPFRLRGADALELDLRDASLAGLEQLVAPETEGAPWNGSVSLRGEATRDASRLRLELGGRGLALSGLALDEVAGTVRADTNELFVETLRVDRGANTVRIEELVLPRTADDARAWLLAARGDLQIALEDVPDLLRIEGDEVPAHALRVAGTIGDGRWILDEGRFETLGGTLELTRGSLVLAPDAPLQEATLDVGLDVSFERLAEVARVFGSDDLQGGLTGTLVLDGTLGAPRAVLAGNVRDLVVAERSLGDGTLNLDATKDGIEVERCSLQGDLGELDLSGGWRTAETSFDDVQLALRVPRLEALGVAPLTAGRADLELALSGPWRTPRGDLRLDAAALVAFDSPADDVELRIAFDGPTARIERCAVASPVGDLSLQGRLEQASDGAVSGILELLEARRERARLALARPARFDWRGAEQWTLEPLVLVDATRERNEESGARTESSDNDATTSESGVAPDASSVASSVAPGGGLRVAATRTSEALRATLSARDFDPLPLFATTPLEGWRTDGIDADVLFEQEPTAIRASYELIVPLLRTAATDDPWTVFASGALAEGRLELADTRIEHAAVGTLQATGSVPLDVSAAEPLAEGPLRLELDLAVALDALAERFASLPQELSGRTTGTLRLGGTWRDSTGSLELSADELGLEPLGTAFAGRRASLELAFQAGEVGVLEPARLVVPGLAELTAEGRVEAPFDLAALARGELDELRAAGTGLTATLSVDDLAPFATLTEAVRRAEGRLESRVTLSGPLTEPAFEGELDVRDTNLRLAASVPPLEGVGALVRFDRSTVRLEQLRAELGAAPIEASGTIALDGDEPVLDIELSGSNVLLVRQSGVRVRANANLTLDGPLSALEAGGEVALTDGRYTNDVDFLGALRGEAAPPSAGGRGLSFVLFRDAPLAQMTLDVAVRSEQPFRVKNNVAKLEVRPDLRLRGTGEVPLLEGRVYIDPGRVSLPSGSLRIESGLVDFRRDAPFEPLLNLSGETRIKGYDIGVRVTGDATAPEIELWSTPSLPGEELLVLFLTGELPEGSVNRRGERAAQTVAVFLAKDYLTRWFSGSGDEDGETLFDRLEIDVGANVTVSGAPTTEVTYYLSSRPRDTGWVPYLAAERDRYDRYNLGVGILFRLR